MSKTAIFHTRAQSDSPETRGKHTETNNVCRDKLSDSEYSVSAKCAGCGCRFVPTGPQRYCGHECYSATLRIPIEQRFWTKVNKTAGCWLWTGSMVQGYGQIMRNRKPAKAHRVAWELTYGEIPADQFVLHRCDVPACVRPDHLFLGTQPENLADARQKGRLDESRPRVNVLTPEQRLDIFNRPWRRGIGLALAREFGVTKSTISHIRLGRFARPQVSARPAPLSVGAQEAFDRVFERVPSVQIPVLGEVR